MYEEFLNKYDKDLKKIFDFGGEYYYNNIIKEKLLRDDEHIKHIINSINLNN